jgi:hypothetical protein
MWRSFFALYDFEPIDPAEGARETVLELPIRPPQR